jgi:hypothetical protein
MMLMEARSAIATRDLARLGQLDRYKLKKYWRTNQDTAINHAAPLTSKGMLLLDVGAPDDDGDTETDSDDDMQNPLVTVVSTNQPSSRRCCGPGRSWRLPRMHLLVGATACFCGVGFGACR